MSTDAAIDLCSQATLLLGEGTIQSFEDGDIGSTCGNLYDTLVEGWLSGYPWGFCKTKRKLARLTDAPLTGWTYAFQLPTDRMSDTYAVFDTDAVSASPIQEFDIFEDKLLANVTDIWLDYIFRPEETKWPPYFKIFAVNALAAAFALPITQDKSLSDDFFAKAFGSPSDNGKGGYYGAAMLIDSQARPPKALPLDPLTAARLS